MLVDMGTYVGTDVKFVEGAFGMTAWEILATVRGGGEVELVDY